MTSVQVVCVVWLGFGLFLWGMTVEMTRASIESKRLTGRLGPWPLPGVMFAVCGTWFIVTAVLIMNGS